ncbi:penicillin-binding transpeptidase domain-containing protein [Paenibacillus alvei]|uniref:penicillin-binding transpeptidase domain-containing protein n=1 Tax=Paenibacillus alvei TaxID=44250 RepID=UPI00028883C1|nr:penicillin-binding transpeptidase domain-containing protein [Paenibacillus alvei]EJW19074.1 penicillin-binding protein 2B [Paenibacillus alvei DSM 29]MCY7486356.1 penicillin-binding protein 2B [Paenibacillus alvei]MCY9542245.1 penicillin-binding transpeptidase domain-containing protein [Paenibacillus alvei]MCY9707318.1 penicillin-binding transpeptidase domain-containing protein [Paenibacillus alvei]MCY9736231.1 penicillin-binding transpeptidase domain-containing protein [Paenibacillus alvei
MNRRIRLRVLALGMIMVFVFLVLIIRTFWIQVINYDFYMEHNVKTWARSEVLLAKRGTIYDRNHKPLALEASAYNLVVFPQEIEKLKQQVRVADGLHQLIGKPVPELNDLISRTKQRQVEVRTEGWLMDYSKLDEFRNLFGKELDYGDWLHFPDYGIGLLKSSKRYYPYNQLAAHVLGYINKEGQAVSGIEGKFDNQLQGVNGQAAFLRDNRGNPIALSSSSITPPIDGQSVTLTIDIEIQRFVDEAMNRVMKQWQPARAMAVVMDPHTMEVLAMSSKPDFNPNRYWNIPNIGALTNNTLHFGYEPGSTFKIVTLAAAIEEGVFRPEDTFVSGFIKVPGNIIHDVKRDGWGTISYQQGLEKSSNVAFVKLGLEKLGKEKLFNYIDRFGFTHPTGIELNGEAAPLIRFERPSEVATATFGQGGVRVNTIQLAAAYASIANGGKWLQTRIVKEAPTSPKTSEHQVVTPATAKEVTERLEQVILKGTGKPAIIDGYRVAGKTGTAQKPAKRGYKKGNWLISFVGYAPADNPKAVVAIVVDEPDLGGDFTLGGQVAMPAFRSIMLSTLQYMGIKPDPNLLASNAGASKTSVKNSSKVDAKNTAIVGNYVLKPVKESAEAIKDKRLQPVILGKGTKVLEQFPQQGEERYEQQPVYLLTSQEKDIPLPSLTGQSLRDALTICQLLDRKTTIIGEGYVAKQVENTAGGQRSVTLYLQSGSYRNQQQGSTSSLNSASNEGRE